MEMKKVSMIVPVYNAEKYLDKCIRSILAQDYSNLEILLIDDGSTDGSPAILDGFARQDNRIRVFHQKNGGAGTAINTGLDHMSGDYLMFLDNDDWAEPQYVSFLVSKIEADQMDIVCCTGWDWYQDSGEKVLLTHGKNRRFDDHEAVRDILSAHAFTTEAMMKKIYRSSLFRDLRCVQGRHYQDTYIFLRLMPSCRHMEYFDVPEYNYLVHSGSITHSGYQSYTVQQVLSYTDNYDLVKKWYPESLRLLEHNIVSVSMSNYMKLLIEGKTELYPEDADFYRRNLTRFKPLFRLDRLKLMLFGAWCLYRISPAWFRSFVLRRRQRIAPAVNAVPADRKKTS